MVGQERLAAGGVDGARKIPQITILVACLPVVDLYRDFVRASYFLRHGGRAGGGAGSGFSNEEEKKKIKRAVVL